jgi:hypothetical protein
MQTYAEVSDSLNVALSPAPWFVALTCGSQAILGAPAVIGTRARAATGSISAYADEPTDGPAIRYPPNAISQSMAG